MPIFIEFMQEALKGYPVMDFTAPPGTVFAQVGPNREAFRPGTEPSVFAQHPLGVFGGGGGSGPPNLGGPPTPGAPKPPESPPKAPHPSKPDDTSGLY